MSVTVSERKNRRWINMKKLLDIVKILILHIMSKASVTIIIIK